MKKTLIAGVLALSLAPGAQATDIWSVIAGGTVVGALVVAASQVQATNTADQNQQRPLQQQRQEPVYIYQSYPTETATGTRSHAYEDPRTKYLRECQRYGYTFDRCKEIWDGIPYQTQDAPQVLTFKHQSKVLEVDNKEYKQRREEALQKPNSVVEHVTIQ